MGYIGVFWWFSVCNTNSARIGSFLYTERQKTATALDKMIFNTCHVFQQQQQSTEAKRRQTDTQTHGQTDNACN